MKREVDYKKAWEKEGEFFQSKLDFFLERKKAGVQSYWNDEIEFHEQLLKKRDKILKQCTKKKKEG